jgi:hypothetical protein
MEIEDTIGKPRPHKDVLDALKCIEQEMMLNPLAMSKKSGPLLIHYSVIRDCLNELLVLRESIKRAEIK